ncbi:aminoacyl-tRNA hydrolase [candidate division KSB1 bacterium]|nr:aminoacyl-tRNA hydrolase [candidate division KSB1 bacterium]
MLYINENISVDERELQFEFIRASGPGGQNINKVATAVQLRFDVEHTRALPPEVQARLIQLGGKRMTTEGVLIITARRFRTQEKNRQDAIERLVALIQRATVIPKVRRPTRPSRASKERRLEIKRRQSATKKKRRFDGTAEDY